MKKIKVKLSRWIFNISIATFLITIVISLITDLLMEHTELLVAVFVVLIIILLGIIFDTVGVAVAAGDKTPFHSMAASRVEGAKHALLLLNNASKVSNFLNDVIGDIAGIISGSATALIVVKIVNLGIPFVNKTVVTILLSSLVACLTVGGKAIGKEVALSHSKEIVFFAGRILHTIDKKTFIKVL